MLRQTFLQSSLRTLVWRVSATRTEQYAVAQLGLLRKSKLLWKTSSKMQQREQEYGAKAVKPQLQYGNSVDIWALGKILNLLVSDVPSHSIIRGKLMPINKEPPTRLINKMMRLASIDRPTAWQCLQDPWMAFEDRFNAQAEKRDRSPIPSLNAIRSIKRIHETPMTPFTSPDDASTEILLSALWPHAQNGYTVSYNELPRAMIVQRKCVGILRLSGSEKNLPWGPMHINRLTIQPDAQGHFTLRPHREHGTPIRRSLAFRNPGAATPILHESNGVSQHPSSMSRDFAEILLAMAKHHGNGEDEAVRKSVDELLIILAKSVHPSSRNPIILPNKDADFLPATFVGRGDQSGPITRRHDGVQPMTLESNACIIGPSSWGSDNPKPVTYPSDCGDVMAGLKDVLSGSQYE